MNSAGFGAIVIVGIGMAAVGGFQLGTLGEPPFHYSSASAEARTEFLNDETEKFGKRLQRSLVNVSGVGPKFNVGETKIEPIARRITLNIDVSGYYSKKGFSQNKNKLRKAVLKVHCPSYNTGRLAKNDVRLLVRFVGTKKKERLGSITISKSDCAGVASV